MHSDSSSDTSKNIILARTVGAKPSVPGTRFGFSRQNVHRGGNFVGVFEIGAWHRFILVGGAWHQVGFSRQNVHPAGNSVSVFEIGAWHRGIRKEWLDLAKQEWP